MILLSYLLCIIIELMIFYGFMLKSPNNPWNPHILKLWPCDVGRLMKEEYYEIMLEIIELFELCYHYCLT